MAQRHGELTSDYSPIGSERMRCVRQQLLPVLCGCTRICWNLFASSSSTFHERTRLWRALWAFVRSCGAIPSTKPLRLVADVGLGTRMELDLSRLTDCLVLCFGAGERDVIPTLHQFCGQSAVALDIGANIGSVAIPAAKYLRSGRVIAFEPSAEMTQCLHTNACLSGAANLTILQTALWRQSGKGRMTVLHAGNPGSACLDWSPEKGDAGVTVQTLRESLPHLERLDFVKLDVEGAEIAVIDGGAELLNRFHPILVTEVNRRQLRRFGYSSEELVRVLKRMGYRCVLREHGELRPLVEKDLDTDLAFNLIAIP